MNNNTSAHQDTKSKKIDIHNEGMKIVRVAALCFAIISFIATAEGLADYVFINKTWQAYVISFGIQAILFVFNLQLPKYVADINMFINNRGINRFVIKVTIIIMYICLLFTSSWFSYVYIANTIYTNTRYIDSNIILDTSYNKYVNDTENYINESVKISQIIISEQLSDLQTLLPQNNDIVETKEQLQKNLDYAQHIQEIKLIELDSALAKKNVAYDMYSQPINERWRSTEELNKEREAYLSALEAYNIAKVNFSDAETAVNEAQTALDGYNSSYNTVVINFLKELLQDEPHLEDYTQNGISKSGLYTYLADLNHLILGMENNVSSETFSNLAKKTQAIKISLSNYASLKNVQHSSLEDILTEMSTTTITIPQPNTKKYEEDATKWNEIWTTRMMHLDTLIKNIPDYSTFETELIADNVTIINFNIITEYDPDSISSNIDELTRDHLFEINAMENAKNLLFSKYSFLAWFSLIFALFMDVSSLLAGLFLYYVKESQKTSQ